MSSVVASLTWHGRLLLKHSMSPINQFFSTISATGAPEERQPASPRRERCTHQSYFKIVQMMKISFFPLLPIFLFNICKKINFVSTFFFEEKIPGPLLMIEQFLFYYHYYFLLFYPNVDFVLNSILFLLPSLNFSKPRGCQ